MAEAVFKHVVQQRGLDITVGSCGSANYHAGEEPDERTVETCRQHGVPIDSQARQLSRSDFDKFDYILGSEWVPVCAKRALFRAFALTLLPLAPVSGRRDLCLHSGRAECTKHREVSSHLRRAEGQ